MAIGSVEVDVVPAAKGWSADLSRQIVPPSGKIGKDIGARIGDSAGREVSERLNLALKSLDSAKINVDTSEAQAKLAALSSEMDAVGKRSDNAKDHVSLLKLGLVGLAPAVIPLGAAAAASFGALAETAGVGLLAVKGIESAMASGTAEGQKYTALLSGVKSGLAGLESTAAAAALPSVTKGAETLKALMPSLNSQTQVYTGLLGQAADHVVHGLGEGFVKLQPLFTALLNDGVKLSASFDHFASGGGLATFGAYVQQNLPAIGHDLDEVATAVAHLLEAGAGQGVTVLNTLGAVATAINAIPVDDLRILVPLVTDTYLAFKGWAFISGTVNNATKALAEFTGASKASAAASLLGTGAGEVRSVRIGQSVAASTGSLTAGVAASRVAAGVGTAATTLGTLAIPAAAAAVSLVGLRVAFDLLKKSQGDYVRTGDQAAAVLKTISTQGQVTTADVAHLGGGMTDFGKTIHSAFGEDSKSAIDKIRDFGSSFAPFTTSGEKAKTAVKSLDNGLTDLAGSGATGARAAFKFLTDESNKLCIPIAVLLKQFPQYAKTLTESGLSTKQLLNANLTTSASYSDLSTKVGLSAQQVQDYSVLVGISTGKVSAGALTNNQLAAAVTRVSVAYDAATQTGSGFLDSLSSFAQATAGDKFATSAQTATLIGATLKAANGDLLSYDSTLNASAVANTGFVTSLQQAAAAEGKHGESSKSLLASIVNLKTGTIDYSKSAAAPLISGLQSIQSAGLAAASAEFQHARATMSGKDAADAAFQVYKNQTGPSLDAALQKLGATSGQAQLLTDKYLGLKGVGSIKTLIEAEGANPVVTVLNKIGTILAKLAGTTWNVTVNASTASANAKILALKRNLESIPGASLSVSRLAQYQNSAMGNLFKAYAAGGVENHLPQIARASAGGMVRVWAEPETRGESYIPHAADGRRPRAHAIMAQTASILGGTYTPFASGGIVPDGKKYKYDGIIYATLAAAENAQTRASAKVAAQLAQTLAGYRSTGISAGNAAFSDHGLSQVVSAPSNFAQATAAVAKYLAAQGKSSTAVVAKLTADNALLAVEVKNRASIADKLATANANLTAAKSNRTGEYNSVRATIVGTGSLTGAGFADTFGIKSFLANKVKVAKQFYADEKTALKHGVDPSLVQQMVEAGPDAAAVTLHTLATANKADVSSIDSLERSLNSTGSAQAAFTGHQFFDSGVNAAQGIVNGLTSQTKAATDAVDKLADAMVKEFRSELGINSPSTVMHELGVYTGQGYTNGMASHLDTVRKTAASYARAALPPTSLGAASAGGGMPRTMVLRVGDRAFTAYVDERAGTVVAAAHDDVEYALRAGAGY